MRIKKVRLLEYTFIGAILGYPLVAGFSAALNLPNSLLSLGLRSLVAFFALLLIVDGIGSSKYGWRKLLIFFLSLFFLAYLSRLVYATLLSGENLSEPASSYWMWVLGAAVIPAFGLSIAKSRDIEWTRMHVHFLIIALLSSCLVALNATTYVSDVVETYDSGRARLETLNPISLGHLGVSLIIASITLLFVYKNSSKLNALVAIAGLLVGGGLVVASNSRGPIAAAACALVFALAAMKGKKKVYIFAVIIGVSVGFVPLLAWLEESFGFAAYSRLLGQSLFNDTNVVARQDLMGAAWNAFLDNPILGGGLELEGAGMYIHNVSIEAFLTTGFFGGMLFFLIQVLSLLMMFRICRRDVKLMWVGMIVVQYIVAAQFSGSLYGSAQLWAAIGFAIYCSSLVGSIKSSSKLNRAVI